MQIHTDDSARLALDALRNLVAQQSSVPDKPLPPERELASEFGVSRRSIRRALAVLEAEGQVWRRQGKGTYVGPTPPSAAFTLTQLSARTNFSEVMEARLHLEPNLAALAAQRASGEQRALILVRRQLPRRGRVEDAGQHHGAEQHQDREGAEIQGPVQPALVGTRFYPDMSCIVRIDWQVRGD